MTKNQKIREKKVRTSTVAKNVSPDSTGVMYNGSATARFVNQRAPPVSNEGRTAILLIARKKQTNSGPCTSSGTNDLNGLQSCLCRTNARE